MKNNFVNFITFTIIALSLKSISCDVYNGVIAGNRTISECNSGDRISEMELRKSTPEFVTQLGYPLEIHNVVTEDGYILTIHRIPGPRGASPVFLQHGQISSSFDWVLLGKNRSLAFLLADQGYDVWMANQRGSTYSTCHQYYHPSDEAYWDFSWHEIGVYDLTAQFTYITNLTKQNLIYVGYSSGTTAFYAFASDRPDVAAKVKAMFALASIAYEYNFKSPVRIFKYFIWGLELYSKLIGLELKGSPLLKLFAEYFCYESELQRNLCAFGVDSLIGYDLSQLDWTAIPLLIDHDSSGNRAATSLKCFIHYLQSAKSGKFQHYDYGTERNLEIYHSREPPDYNISNIHVPIGIYWSENDYLVSPIDVKRFYEQLPNKMFSRKIKYKKFNHFDYMMAKNATEFLYYDLLSDIKMYK